MRAAGDYSRGNKGRRKRKHDKACDSDEDVTIHAIPLVFGGSVTSSGGSRPPFPSPGGGPFGLTWLESKEEAAQRHEPPPSRSLFYLKTAHKDMI